LTNQQITLNDSLNNAFNKKKLYENKGKLLNAKLILKNKKINLQQNKLDELSAEKKALVKLKLDIKKKKSDASNYRNQEIHKKREVSQLTFCPNNKSWSDCTHLSNKEEYSRSKKNLEAEIQVLSNKIMTSDDFVREHSPKYSERATSYNAVIDGERYKMRELMREKEELKTSSVEIADEFFKYTWLINKYKNLYTEWEQHWSKYNDY